MAAIPFRGKLSASLRFAGAIVIIIPIVMWWYEYTVVTPAPVYHRYGEVVTYFIDSLAVFNGSTYSYIDHPGTPVSIIGSVLLALTYPFIGGVNFTLYHLSHPLIFVTLSNIFLALSFVISTIYFYRASLSILKKMTLAASLFLSLMYFWLHTQSIEAITLWQHNPLAYSFGMPLLLFLFLLVMNDRRIENRQLLLFGFLTGVFSAIQFFFGSWLIGSLVTIFIFYRLKRETIWTALKADFLLIVSAVIGFLTAVLPIIHKLPQFFRWIIGVIATSHRYADGPYSLASWAEFKGGFLNLITTQPVLFQSAAILVSLFLVLILTGNRTALPAGLSAMGFGMTLQTILLTLVFTRENGPLYGLSIAAILPVLALVNLRLLEERLNFLNQQRYNFGYSIIIICLLAGAGIKTIARLGAAITIYRDTVAYENRLNAAARAFISDYAKNAGPEEQAPVIIYTPDALDGCAALLFGRSYARLDIDAELSQICPNQYYMDYWLKRVFIKDKLYPIHQLDWDLLIVSKSYLKQELRFLIRNEIINEVFPGYIIVVNTRYD